MRGKKTESQFQILFACIIITSTAHATPVFLWSSRIIAFSTPSYRVFSNPFRQNMDKSGEVDNIPLSPSLSVHIWSVGTVQMTFSIF